MFQHLSNTLYFQPFLLIIRVSLVISHAHSLMPESVSFFPTVAISEDREILGGRSLLRLSISHHVYTSDLEYLGLGNGLSQERHISSESLVWWINYLLVSPHRYSCIMFYSTALNHSAHCIPISWKWRVVMHLGRGTSIWASWWASLSKLKCQPEHNGIYAFRNIYSTSQ